MLIDLNRMERVMNYIRTHKKCRIRHDDTEIFSSHTIIRVYCKLYEHDYVSLIIEHQDDEHVFQSVHSQIGRYVSENMANLGVKKHLVSRKSLTVHHTDDYPMWWEFR